MTDSTKQIILVSAGAVFAYVPTLATPPKSWWAWTLFLCGMGAAIVNAVRALYNSSVTDERTRRKG